MYRTSSEPELHPEQLGAGVHVEDPVRLRGPHDARPGRPVRRRRVLQSAPIAAEYYGDETAFYVVAVAWKSNKKLTLNNMKLSQVCSSGIGKSSGWVVPVNLLETEQINVRGVPAR